MSRTYATVCSGIEAPGVAWQGLGWRPLWCSEIESFPRAVLAYRWPHVPDLGDMRQLAAWVRAGWIDAPDVLVGGTPCQSFSVAGKRHGLADERGALVWAFIDLADAIDEMRAARGESPCVVLWENVPGVLNGRDNAFGCFLGGLCGEENELQPAGAKWTYSGCVFGPRRTIAWRTLDAQYFGVAQRRRRVFVVARAGNGADPGAVLFESDGVCRDSPPSREARQDIAGALGGSSQSGGFRTTDLDNNGAFVPYGMDGYGGMRKLPGLSDPLRATRGNYGGGSEAVIVVHGTQDPDVLLDRAHTLGLNSGRENAVVFKSSYYTRGKDGAPATVVPPLSADADKGDQDPIIYTGARVRRLTPRECERVQGFPDDYTLIPYRGKPAEQCPDTPRYKALGNSMAVPVVRWIGERIKQESTP